MVLFMQKQRRKSIPHIQSLSKEQISTILENNYEVRLKIDGAPVYLGVDENGSRYISTSRSGVIKDPNEFTTYARNRGFRDASLRRAESYSTMFSEFLNCGIYDLFSHGLEYKFEVLNKDFGYFVDDGVFSFVKMHFPVKMFPKRFTLYSHFSYDMLTGYQTTQLEIRDTAIDVELSPCLNYDSLVEQNSDLIHHEGVVIRCGDFCVKMINPLYSNLRGFR